ncbi:hypothetical protein LINPERPRIM_LOCUS38325 [Linum perenne]
MKKFVREALDVKVCLLRTRTIPCPEELKVELNDGEVCAIDIVQMQAREYGKRQSTKIVYVPKTIRNDEKVEEGQTSGDPEPEPESAGAEEPKANSDNVSGTKKKKKKKKKGSRKSVVVEDEKSGEEISEVEVNCQNEQVSQSSNPRDSFEAGIESASSIEGMDSPDNVRPQGTEESGEKVTLEQQSPQVQEVDLPNVEYSKKTTIIDDNEEWTHDGHKTTFDAFLQYSKPAKPKQLKFVSGVKTRQKNRQR